MHLLYFALDISARIQYIIVLPQLPSGRTEVASLDFVLDVVFVVADSCCWCMPFNNTAVNLFTLRDFSRTRKTAPAQQHISIKYTRMNGRLDLLGPASSSNKQCSN